MYAGDNRRRMASLPLPSFRPGDRVSVRGRCATFVKPWGAGAVVRYDDAPGDPRVVPLGRVRPHPPEQRPATNRS